MKVNIYEQWCYINVSTEEEKKKIEKYIHTNLSIIDIFNKLNIKYVDISVVNSSHYVNNFSNIYIEDITRTARIKIYNDAST